MKGYKMRKYLLLFMLLFSCKLHATTVTATITDIDGQTWNNGTWAASLQGSYPLYVNGTPVTTISVAGSMSSSGVLTGTLTDNSTISPINSFWRFTICPFASAPCSTVDTPVTGSSANLSSVLSAGVKAPRFSAGPGAYGYSDVEVNTTPYPGGTYFNVTSSTLRMWAVTSFVAVTSGSPTVVYMNTTFNEASAGSGIQGTTPATCTTCNGTWTDTLAGVSNWLYASPNGATSSTPTTTVYMVLNVGQTNYTFRAHVAACITTTDICQLTVRRTDTTNYIEIEMSSAGVDVFDVVSNVGTRIGSNIPGAIVTGDYTVTLSGTAFSITTPNGTTSGTTANTGTLVGMEYHTGSTTPFTITSMSVKSN